MIAIARFALVAVAAAAVLAGPVSARSTGIGFTFVPKHVVQGEDARVSVSVRPTGSRCTLSVRYQGGTPQGGLAPALASRGSVTWTWHVPATVQAGQAQATVRCARVGSARRSLVIVGRLVEPKITVAKQGFSIRPTTTGGSHLSYGLMLHNDSPKDAVDVRVQVNFVMADNNLLGTDTVRVAGIAAGSDYALGHMISFPGSAPIVRLEVVIQVDTYQQHKLHDPTLANIHILPLAFDPRWVGSIEGEMQNTDPVLTLSNTTLSAVVFDANGNVIGGASGLSFGALPSGARAFIKISSGLDAIPIERAASTMVSMAPTWQQPGA